MASVIDQAIPDQAFEILRDRIGLILAEELAVQYVLKSLPGTTPKVFVERFAQIDATECPVINVMLDRGDYDNQDPTTARGTFNFSVDVYTTAASKTGGVRGDAASVIGLHKLMGICRAIIQDARYIRLGFDPGFVMRRQVTSIQIADQTKSKDVNNAVMGRLNVLVAAPEVSGFDTALAIGGFDTQVKLHSTELGYVFSGDDFPAPPITGSEIKVNGAFLIDLQCGDLLSISVINSTGDDVGQIINQETVLVRNSIAKLVDSLDNLIEAKEIAAEGEEKLIAPDNEATVNSTPYATVPSGTPIDVDVEDTAGADVGSLVGGKWQIANATVENSNSTVSVSVEAEGSDVFPDTPIKANGDLVINQPSGVEKDVVVRYETQGVVPTTIVSGEVVVPDAPTFDNSEVWFNGLKVAELASGETWFQIVKVNGELPDSVEWDSPNANFNLIKAGGGGATLTIGAFSDSGATIPITSADYGTTIYIKATATATQENFTLFIDNGIQSLLPVVAIDNADSHVFEYTINLTGTLDIYVIASDNTNGIADSEPFEFTVTGVYPPSITGNVLWVDGALESTYVLNATFVQQLNDLSGLSNHLSAPTVGDQPTYLDAPNGINGQRSTQFASGKYLQKLGFSLDIVTGNSVWMVIEFNTSSNGVIVLNADAIGSTNGYYFIQQQSLGIRTYQQAAAYSPTYPIALSTKYLLETHRTPTQERFYINGVLKHTIAITASGSLSNLYINNGYFGGGGSTIADMAVFNTIISPTNETDIRAQLMSKWNIV